MSHINNSLGRSQIGLKAKDKAGGGDTHSATLQEKQSGSSSLCTP